MKWRIVWQPRPRIGIYFVFVFGKKIDSVEYFRRFAMVGVHTAESMR